MTYPPESTSAAPSVSFDRAADFYDQTRGFAPGHDGPAVSLFLRDGHMQPHHRALEIGAGTGRILAPLMTQFQGQMHGLDISPEMLSRVRAKIDSPRLHLVLGDALRLPYPDASFDAVLGVHVLHLVGDYRRVLHEVARVLKPDGVFMHGWGQRMHDAALMRTWQNAIGEENRPDNWYGHAENVPVLLEAGWQPEPVLHTYTYHEEKAPKAFLDSLVHRYWSQTWSMSDEQLQRGIDAVRAYIGDHYTHPEVPQPFQQTFRVRAYRPPAAAQ
jgi:ubiquinone/menaquinone biosynthesis C-methylase UbiE